MSVAVRRRSRSFIAFALLAAFTPVALADQPADISRRIEERIADLRAMKLDAIDSWVPAVRELVEIGEPALPALIAELDRTTDDKPLRALTFTLRALGDARAVPALIRAIPRTNIDAGSDYGGLGRESVHVAFMRKHDLGDDRDGGFDFGRPVNEVFGTLKKFTGQTFDDNELRFVSPRGGERQQKLQRRLFHRVAEKAAIWWEANWQRYTNDAAYAKVNLPPFDEEIPLDPFLKNGVSKLFPTGPSVRDDDGASGAILGPPPAQKGFHRSFLDLDTMREVPWPKTLGEPNDVPPGKLAAWASEECFDLQGVDHTLPDGRHCWALKGIGLKAWQIDDDRWRTLANEMKSGEPSKLDHPADDLLISTDPTTGVPDPHRPATFLFVTADGACGLLKIRGQVSGRAVPGTPVSPNDLTGFYDGVVFDLKLIYEADEEGANR